MNIRNGRDERIFAMHKSGMTLSAIAKKVGLTSGGVRYVIERYERNGHPRVHDPFLGLSSRIRKCLRDNGIDTPEDLVARWTSSKLTPYRVSGRRYPRDFWVMSKIGPKSLAEIEEWIKARQRADTGRV